jgi:hypothetical protein
MDQMEMFQNILQTKLPSVTPQADASASLIPVVAYPSHQLQVLQAQEVHKQIAS